MSFGAQKWAEMYRINVPGYGRGDRQNGIFEFRDGIRAIISNGMGWEHVSVSRRSRIPSYDDMCRMKDAFWGKDDCVMQLHVPEADHVNCCEYCLHLWRPVDQEIPRPPKILVGPS